MTTMINSAEVGGLLCPQPGCRASPEEYEVESLVPREVYEKYLQFTVLAIVQKDPNMCWCPNKACGNAILWDRKQHKVVCPACRLEFCFACGGKVHFGFDCKGAPNSDEMFREWMGEKGSKVKPCPSCRMPVEKNEGCNHITCRCGHQWCWLCLSDYQSGHFNEGPCEGMQFSTQDSLFEPPAPREPTPEPTPPPEEWEQLPPELMVPTEVWERLPGEEPGWEEIPPELLVPDDDAPAPRLTTSEWEEIPAELLAPPEVTPPPPAAAAPAALLPSTSAIPSASPAEATPPLAREDSLSEIYRRRVFLRL